ncbi:ankyrin repeat domain-containing protein [Comamonas testosteroni]|uniref:Ankyrin repeat domain-containing protein n=1 Tax=Comamonas testosteroni TaxID=285 RepID=A0A373FPE5_COMTE|nr:ankyrin repeat domain-containing protein [Comamonas testosteroni]RGE45412.1 ankyrin repeat domain-containing protein [Comamonas testosteroni]
MSLSAAIVLRASRRQSLRWLGAAAAGSAAGLSQPVWANAYDDYSRALVSDNASAMLNLIFRGFDPNTLDTRGRPGLVSALHQDSLKVVDELLKAPKINVNLASKQNETPLMMACIKGHLDLAKRLIKMGADVNREGWAPLHYAASADTPQTLDIIKLLLENSAYIDAASPNGTTPLMLAAQYSSEAVVKLLLEEGADITLRNQRNMTAADFAKLVDRQYMVDLLGKALQKERRTQPSRGGW